VRVALDLTALVPERTGVDTYMLGLVRGLAEQEEDGARYTLFVNAGDEDALAGLPPHFDVRRASLRPRPVRLAFQQALLPAYAAARGVDVVHSPAFISPLVRGGARHVLTVHDLTSFSMPEAHTRLRRSGAYRALVTRSIRRADVVTVPSQWVADDLLRRFPGVPPGRVRVDPPGIGAQFRPQSDDEIAVALRRLGIERPYLLFVGTLQPRKNLPVLVEAYAALAARRADLPRLVLAGPTGWGSDGLGALLDRPGLRERIVLPGYVPDADLAPLYAGAELFLFPSLAEGFGFPPLEAMACGTPVVAADSSSLRENLAGAAELVPPEDPRALALAIERLLADDSGRAERRDAGLARARTFTWIELGRRLATTYAKLARDR
jgi:glycosyltransferase involved in cell wall biosynthesis